MNKLYIIIPAYNEAANITSVIKDWYGIVKKYGDLESKLVVIDDGSKDETFCIMEQISREEWYNNLIVLTKENGGHGETILYGYQYALENGADYIFQTDSDGQTVSDEFEEFWKQRENYDMLIGHRINREDGFSRIIVTKTLKAVIRICFGVTVTDANTPFRLMKAEALLACIEKVPKRFNLSNVLIAVLFEKEKKSVKYFPITFHQRQGGINSINIKNLLVIGLNAIKDFIKIKNIL